MSKRSGWFILVMVPVGALAGLLLAAIVTFLMPRIYESEAIVEIKPRHGDVLSKEVRPEGVSPEEFVSPWLLREISSMKSHDSLLAVIKRLELEKRWKVDEKTALRDLNGIVSAQSIRSSDLVAIRVRHTNKVDAKDIAMELARTYQAYRRKTDQRDAEEVLGRMRKAIVNQADKVNERRKILKVVASYSGNIYKGTDPSIRQIFEELEPKPVKDDRQDKALQHFHQLEKERLLLESQLHGLLVYDSDKLIDYAAGLELPENIIPTTFPKYQEAKRELDKLKFDGLGDQHPTLKTKIGQIEEMKRQIDECVVMLRATLKTRLELATKHLDSIGASQNTRNPDESGLTAADCIASISDFETDLKLLQTMNLKLISDEILLKFPFTGAEIHESPVISESPVSPNVTLNFGLGTVLGMILFPLMSLPVIGLLNRRRTV